MTKVEQIERQIQELSSEEFAELCEWILERDWEAWDEQIEEDVRAGRLDELIDESKTLLDLRRKQSGSPNRTQKKSVFYET